MIASLPMYDLPEIRAETDGFWAALASVYGTKSGLTRGGDFQAPWRSPDLLFSQTCGFPFTHEFAGQLNYVATPCYDADGCDGPRYCSLVLAREVQPLEVFRNSVVAFNSSNSMSGWLALKLVFAEKNNLRQPLFRAAVETGSHAASLFAVQQGKADVCAIDCVTVALLRKHRPSALRGLNEIARSPAVPGLPYVTRVADMRRMRGALSKVMQDASLQSMRDALLLKGFETLPLGSYDIISQFSKKLHDVEL